MEAVKGKSDDEIKKLLIRTVKEGDPARLAALLVAPYYMESAITQSARLTPVVKAMRLQDQNQENRYIQPTNLSFMGFPNTILIPLQPTRTTSLTRTRGTSSRNATRTRPRRRTRIFTALRP